MNSLQGDYSDHSVDGGHDHDAIGDDDEIDDNDDRHHSHDELLLTLQQRTGLSRGLWGEKEEEVNKLKYIDVFQFE